MSDATARAPAFECQTFKNIMFPIHKTIEICSAATRKHFGRYLSTIKAFRAIKTDRQVEENRSLDARQDTCSVRVPTHLCSITTQYLHEPSRCVLKTIDSVLYVTAVIESYKYTKLLSYEKKIHTKGIRITEFIIYHQLLPTTPFVCNSIYEDSHNSQVFLRAQNTT